jgi:lipopolysaccharide transport system ATP-binding protein
MSSIISVENLSKVYRIGKKADRADSFMGMLQDSVTAPFRNWRRMRQPTGESREQADELHWALRDVSFEVKEGEVLGVIGRNGAGKSTLLKVLSRITEPTSGEVRIRGRVASLLEVGTGFHPELTGRENVYLNGTILGMTKREIDKKFDEIVDFSGVEKFLDAPVKRYSSGMKVRLAFAVAAHLDPEILIIDEVLAVGDVDFQKKCLGKMGDVASSGRTILFVSHNTAALIALCKSGILLESGRVRLKTDLSSCISLYSSQFQQTHTGDLDLTMHRNRRASAEPVLSRFRILNKAGVPISIINAEDGFVMEFEVSPKYATESMHFAIGIDSVRYGRVCSFATFFSPKNSSLHVNPGDRIRCESNSLQLASGFYSLSLSAGTVANKLLDAIDDACVIEVTPPRFLESRIVAYDGMGALAAEAAWKVLPENRP